jgi:hypothetical protein
LQLPGLLFCSHQGFFRRLFVGLLRLVQEPIKKSLEPVR